MQKTPIKLKANEPPMNPSDKSPRTRTRLPLWQSEKMRLMIEERWEEVWRIVITRNNYQRS